VANTSREQRPNAVGLGGSSAVRAQSLPNPERVKGRNPGFHQITGRGASVFGVISEKTFGEEKGRHRLRTILLGVIVAGNGRQKKSGTEILFADFCRIFSMFLSKSCVFFVTLFKSILIGNPANKACGLVA
jgi:hypothetical protein